ncbi:gas vesicle structural protein GvpA [Streptomyces sp. LP05-1]|uniref:Gas vesicle protein A n=1 Tax=Streptomyces pyxinae TaxID=2970734 RepID=A0ABT2CPE3_9ACTN|nr:gas vesicle structural protein GvpA [Streptomyces sp. LP05-1]MCS0638536.1 gas vesicle structural protein GvpA [Streptomyces sp. LP05-1]
MTVVPQSGGGPVAAGGGGGGGSSSLYDVLELILDRGLVIDVFVRVSLVGIEILKVDARVVVASVDTYLRFAEACNRLDLESRDKAPAKLPELVGEITEGGARGKSKGALTGAVEAFSESFRKGRDTRDTGESTTAGADAAGEPAEYAAYADGAGADGAEPEPVRERPRPRSGQRRPVRRREERGDG